MRELRASSVEAPARRSRFWRRALPLLSVAVVLFALDVSRAPEKQLSASFLLRSIELYQANVSSRLGSMGVSCRFEPTCSHYGHASIEKYGTVKGVGKTAWRVLRCNPMTPRGTIDPP